ncbi:MAG TPA: sulfurtransferase [Limnochordia bacterium]|nr:sulfurtransferase [Limnochordia bacterium]
MVDVAWLRTHLGTPNLAVFDCRFTLGDPDAGRSQYLAGHLPGALFLELERDLSAPAGRGRGRHPLPEPARLAARLGQLGVGPDTTVVVYDDGAGGMAPRAWWLLGYLGLERVAVLDGGLRTWTAAGGTLAAGSSDEAAALARPPRPLPVQLRADWVCDLDEMTRLVADPKTQTVTVDARAPERYRGDYEPLDPVGGHIPGAINLPWTETVSADGRRRSPAELAAHFAALRDRDVVVYCGSGVTACSNLLAMQVAGIQGARLYPGSWSEWCADPSRPTAKGG